MSSNSRICTQCGWEDRAFKPQRERPVSAGIPVSPPPQHAAAAFTCPICHSRSGISHGRCNNCGNLIESANYGEQTTTAFDSAPVAGQEQFKVRQQHPGTHDAKLSYACPRCTARLDPSSGRCPNCGYMGSMEYSIPHSQSTFIPPPPKSAPPPTQHTVPAQHYHRTDSVSSKTCPNCQANISSDSRICPYCGGYCGTGRKMFSGAEKKSTLERAYEAAAYGGASSSFVPPPQTAGYYPERTEPVPGMAGRIPGEDRMQPRGKKKRKEKEPKELKEPGEGSGKRRFPLGLLIAVIIVAVALVGMVIFVLIQELSSPSMPAATTGPSSSGSDTLAPIISNIQVTDIKDTSAVVKWNTDERATSEVQLCDEGDMCIFAKNDSLVKEHSLKVPNLTKGMEYHVTVRSLDAAGNEETVEWDSTFTTGGQAENRRRASDHRIQGWPAGPDFSLNNLDDVLTNLYDYRG